MTRNLKNLSLILVVGISLSSCVGRKDSSTNDWDTSTIVIEEVSDAAASQTSELQNKLDEIKNMPELQNYKGLYKVTDESGTTFDIYFTKDNGVIITNSNGDIYYCSYKDYTNIDSGIYVQPSEGNIEITFKGGNSSIENYNNIVIKDNWLYAEPDFADSNNPNWRLPLDIEKAFNVKKSSTSHNSSAGKSSKTSSTEEKIVKADKETKSASKKSSGSDISEKERVQLETMMYGYNEAAWRAKKRQDAQN